MTMTESLSRAPATLAAFDGDLLRARIFTEKYTLRTTDPRVRARLRISGSASRPALPVSKRPHSSRHGRRAFCGC